MPNMMNGLKIGSWANTAKHFVYTSKLLTASTQDFPFSFNLRSEEPKESNIRLEYFYGYL